MNAKAPELILFEPAAVQSMGPPVDHRPVWELRVGALSLAERLERVADVPVSGFWTRPALRSIRPLPQPTLFESDRVILLAGDLLLLDTETRARVLDLSPGQSIDDEAGPAALCMQGVEAREWLHALDHDVALPDPGAEAATGSLGPRIRFWWELFELAPQALKADLPLLTAGEDWRIEGDVTLSADAQVAGGVVIDASGGPVVIDRGVKLGAGSFVQGPCYLGPDTQVKALSILLHGCYAGPQCRLGGEIEETQFQGFANKQHHGFLGHAVVGEWVNLGAGVTNSDLKNNYSDVRVRQGDREIDSHRRFLGCCLGDHVKVAIQGRINTGTVLEAFTNWFGSAFPPKGLPAFTWGGDGVLQGYDLGRALSTAAVVMGRRGVRLDEELASIYRSHHELTEAARESRFA